MLDYTILYIHTPVVPDNDEVGQVGRQSRLTWLAQTEQQLPSLSGLSGTSAFVASCGAALLVCAATAVTSQVAGARWGCSISCTCYNIHIC